jgi:hypothetical protein
MSSLMITSSDRYWWLQSNRLTATRMSILTGDFELCFLYFSIFFFQDSEANNEVSMNTFQFVLYNLFEHIIVNFYEKFLLMTKLFSENFFCFNRTNCIEKKYVQSLIIYVSRKMREHFVFCTFWLNNFLISPSSTIIWHIKSHQVIF